MKFELDMYTINTYLKNQRVRVWAELKRLKSGIMGSVSALMNHRFPSTVSRLWPVKLLSATKNISAMWT